MVRDILSHILKSGIFCRSYATILNVSGSIVPPYVKLGLCLVKSLNDRHRQSVGLSAQFCHGDQTMVGDVTVRLSGTRRLDARQFVDTLW